MLKARSFVYFLIVVNIAIVTVYSLRISKAAIGTPGSTPDTCTVLGLGGTSGSFYPAGTSIRHYYHFFMKAAQASTFRIKGNGIVNLYIKDGVNAANTRKSETHWLGETPIDFTWDTSDDWGGLLEIEQSGVPPATSYSFEWIFQEKRGSWPFEYWVPMGTGWDTAYSNVPSGGHPLEGKLSSTDQYYSVCFGSSAGFIASIRGGSGTDFDLYIYDASHNLIDSATSASYPHTVAFTPPTPTAPTYVGSYILVKPNSGSGEYRLEFSSPRLQDYKVDPIYVRPGRSFSANYSIRSWFADNVPVGLGCSIRDPYGKGYSDPSHDTLISVSSGTKWYPRLFTIPSNAPDGWYDVWWATYGKYDPSSGFGVEFDSTWWVNDRLLVDGTRPSNPTDYACSHYATQWSSDNTIDMNWLGAFDGLSGVKGYWYVWDTSDSTDPENKLFTSDTSVTSQPLSSGSNWYFHIRTMDNAGNLAYEAVHFGPFYIDTTKPTNPTGMHACSHSKQVWSSDNTIDISWSGASDSPSGVYGYKYVWDTSTTTIPPGIGKEVDTSETSCTSRDLSTGNNWYFHVRAVDDAGNWANGAFHVGPFYIDIDPPSTPDPDDGIPGWSNDNTPTFYWGSSSDSGSGVAGYEWNIDDGPETWTTSTSVTLSPQPDDYHTFYVRAKDYAGLFSDYWGSHDFQIDVTKPAISNVNQNPPRDSVQPNQNVGVRADVRDATSGVNEVVLSYRYSTDNGITWSSWTTVSMSLETGNTFKGDIEGFPLGTRVQYQIIAYDNAGNSFIDDKAGQYYPYTVVPEFSFVLTLPLFMLSTLIAMLLTRKRKSHARNSSINSQLFMC